MRVLQSESFIQIATLLLAVARIGWIASSPGPHFLVCVCDVCGVSWVLSWEAWPWRVSVGGMGEETACISSDHPSWRAGEAGRVLFWVVGTKMEAHQKLGWHIARWENVQLFYPHPPTLNSLPHKYSCFVIRQLLGGKIWIEIHRRILKERISVKRVTMRPLSRLTIFLLDWCFPSTYFLFTGRGQQAWRRRTPRGYLHICSAVNNSALAQTCRLHGSKTKFLQLMGCFLLRLKFSNNPLVLRPAFIAVIIQLLSRVWLCNPMDYSMPGFPVLHHLPEFAQSHVHRVGDAIQPSHPLSPPSPPALQGSSVNTIPSILVSHAWSAPLVSGLLESAQLLAISLGL